MTELAFVKNLVGVLAAQPAVFASDFQQPPEQQLKRVPVLQISVPPPPPPAAPGQPALSVLSVSFKSSKPPFAATLDISPADSIASIKAHIAAQPDAPPAEAQRLLLRGKALSDTKLAKDYDIRPGDTVNIMVKPGFAPAPPLVAPKPTQPADSSLALPTDAPRKRSHGRIPSVVLSPSPSPSTDDKDLRDIPLVDENGVTISADLDQPAEHGAQPQSTYHATVASPEYWDRLFSFMMSQFPVRSDALQAFEDYLNASKGALSASEIARIRDHVGVIGMAGT
ncbi:hypothetical protein K488DRAFT_44989 [Vararia minispora EC-137]|uniref:Uncharacterized protein n=1 Tax=Vararia minispora EC-137 TaxID=1314806 RepID=A0ACB8QS51_9AGAM|nr:hypothetical protein K488DRAFT_44989 [Vararia minispora EC-137]